jgi:hypothetical protein
MELWMPEYGVGHGIWMATGYLFAFVLVAAPLFFAIAIKRGRYGPPDRHLRGVKDSRR